MCGRNGAVGHGHGVLGKRLDATKGFSESKDLKGLEEVASLLETTFEVEGDHTTGALRLLLVDFVTRVALEAGVHTFQYFLVALKELGDGQGVRLSAFDSDLEGLGASDNDPGIESGETCSHSLHDEVKSVVKHLVVEHEGSSNHIRMATNVLGERVGYNIGTEEEGVLVNRGSEGVVNNEEDTGTFKGVSDLADIEDFQGRVGGGLQPADLSGGSNLPLELLDVAEVGHGDFDISVGR